MNQEYTHKTLLSTSVRQLIIPWVLSIHMPPGKDAL